MNTTTAKRIVVGSMATIVVVTEARRITDGEGPDVTTAVGGLLAGSFLAAFAGPAPDAAAVLALSALVAAVIKDGPSVAEKVTKAKIGDATKDQDYSNSTPISRSALVTGIGGSMMANTMTGLAGSIGAPANVTTWQTQWGPITSSVTFAAKLAPMIVKAWEDGGHKLYGSAWRSNETQIALRKEHGCGGALVYDKSCKGNPPTAVPGTSRHETGDAIDFSNLTDAAFAWLQKNAASYGIYNLPSERWHWSTDGN